MCWNYFYYFLSLINYWLFILRVIINFILFINAQHNTTNNYFIINIYILILLIILLKKKKKKLMNGEKKEEELFSLKLIV